MDYHIFNFQHRTTIDKALIISPTLESSMCTSIPESLIDTNTV